MLGVATLLVGGCCCDESTSLSGGRWLLFYKYKKINIMQVNTIYSTVTLSLDLS